MSNGQIIVYAKGEEVRIKLNNVIVSNSSASPLFIQKAENAIISKIKSDCIEVENKESSWYGAVVREIKGIGDRSAYGLPDEYGVIIVDINDNEIFKRSEIQNGDVIMKVEQTIITSVDQLKYQLTRKSKNIKSRYKFIGTSSSWINY